MIHITLATDLQYAATVLIYDRTEINGDIMVAKY